MPEVELGGFSFMATPVANKAPQSDILFRLVDNRFLDHDFDDMIIPRLENLMLNVEMPKTPQDFHRW